MFENGYVRDDFISPSLGKMTFQEVVNRIKDTVNKFPNDEFRITVGTDSQNFDITKIVLVIVLEHVGKGSIFLYQITKVNIIRDIRTKLFTETQISLECADKLIRILEKEYEDNGFDYTKLGFAIHVDAGRNGKTNVVIPEIVGWVTSCGYDCVTKPDSYAASSVADKYSK